MNAKMIAMGQSVDIQKMPRPKPGSQMAQKQAMFTPSGSDLEKMLYPKNFKPRTFDAESENTNNKNDAEIIQAVEEEIIEVVKEKPKIIGDDEGVIFEPKPTEEREVSSKSFSGTRWERCKYYKPQGERAFCKEYLGWCAKEKCPRPNC